MREILDDMCRIARSGRRLVLARVVEVEGSGPRLVGAAMAVAEDGEVLGSVSGGCVEGAVVAEALSMLDTPTSHRARSVSFGYSDEQALDVGLTCGGTLHLLMCEWDATDELHERLSEAIRTGESVALAAVVEVATDGVVPDDDLVDAAMTCLPGSLVGRRLLFDESGPLAGGLGMSDLDLAVMGCARTVFRSGSSSVASVPIGIENQGIPVKVSIEVFVPKPRMIVVGAADFSAALTRMAAAAGYRVTVCDPRPSFATPARFPAADEVVVTWPDRYLAGEVSSLGARDAICVLSHDNKVDVPAIVTALSSTVGYVGALGSRGTHRRRMELLVQAAREAGLAETELGRLRAPIGLDIGAQTPEETAVAILAEVIALARGSAQAENRSLSLGSGPIHKREDVETLLAGAR